MTDTFEKLVGIPAYSLPREGTKAHTLLMMYIHNEVVTEWEAAEAVGLNFRAVIQQLGNKKHHHWNILEELGPDGKIAARRLDPRHLNGDRQHDAKARAERRRKLAALSYKLAKQGRKRTELARIELMLATVVLDSMKENAPTEAEA